MNFETMSQTRTRAWMAVLIWGVAGVGLAVAFFSGAGAVGFPGDSIRHLAAAGAIAFGFLGHWISLWATRRREGDPPLSDERDSQTLARANQASLVVVLVGIFTFTIGLWTVYEAAGLVPVGWMWLLAYGSVILASLASAVTILILDRRVDGHE